MKIKYYYCSPSILYAQKGTSLVELMLAYALGLFLLTGLTQAYLTIRRNSDMQQAITAAQENGRFAVNFLQQYIRMAGYSACDPTSSFVNQTLAIQGYENNLPDYLQGKVMTNTDSVSIGSCQVRNGKSQFQQTAFFISATTRKNALGKTVYSLYETSPGSDKRELVANIENMKINYGVSDDYGKNVDHYASATAVNDWQRVRLVSIRLLIGSETPVFPKPIPYSFAEKMMTADRFLHKEWLVDIALRER